jgi:hypothetical protein
MRWLLIAGVSLACVAPLEGQMLTERGFIEGSGFFFPQRAPNDATPLVGDLSARGEVFVKPERWIQFSAGVDVRANSHDQVEDRWRFDVDDRGVTRPRLSLRRATITFTRGPLTVDLGKQFIRWGKADIVNPTDRFAPRDFLDVVDAGFLAVIGVHGVVQARNETFEAVWLPRFTPSRSPLFNQRWTAVPESATAIAIVDGGSVLPGGSERAVRWAHVGGGVEISVSFFDGFNHLPNIDARVDPARRAVEVVRRYPPIRTYGADAAIPTRWFTVKGETAYFTSSSASTDEYVLYVVQLERQTGEWIFVGGYAGEVVTARRAALTFAPDRGMTRSIVGRASYTVDPNRSVAFEGAVRQNGDGEYAKLEYSQAQGQHWRTTLTGVAITGHADDFLGQYHRNSHVKVSVRYSF